MNTFLFAWNPKRYDWVDLEDNIKQIASVGKCLSRWSCGNLKSINEGDRIFLVRVGQEPKGIIGEGFATSAPFAGRHWGDDDKEAFYIDVEFEVLLNSEIEPILEVGKLTDGKLSKQVWTPQAAISIKTEIVDEFEEMWFSFLTTKKLRRNPFANVNNESQGKYIEGTPTFKTTTIYERNPFARKKCLEFYGFSCLICDFNFEKVYGEIGRDFIHVHHLKPISDIGEAYQVDPLKDLIPVCPNCHSIIHKRKEPLTIEEMKSLLIGNKSNG